MIKDNRGMSLLEVLLAATILGAFLIAFSVMAGNNMLWNKKNEERHYAAILSHMCMEMSKGQEFDELNVDNNGVPIFDSNDDVESELSLCNLEENGELTEFSDRDATINNHTYGISRIIDGKESTDDGDYDLYSIRITCKKEEDDDDPFELESKYLDITGSD